MAKRGDVVILILGGKSYYALVLALSAAGDSHLGEAGEPALHLSYLPDEPIDTNTKKPKAMPPGFIPETVTLHDVVHASQEFDAAYMEQHGLRAAREGDPLIASAQAEIRSRRGAGEWREVAEVVAGEPAVDKALDAIASQADPSASPTA